MTDATASCSRCGAPLVDADADLCPACLLKLGLEPPTAGGETVLATPSAPSNISGSASTLTSIGPYRLVKPLGEGGMGIVYLAEQTEPIRRTVALKLIKLGMDTHEVVARFEAERQALALMDHPNIASVLDAGATPDGRPYFVMEYAPGAPITDYCDAHQLGTRTRLELFLAVCSAVQHAHHKGIIHRDLKPSNVLVTEQDGKPSPKVIDFGIAKATDQRLSQKTMFTQHGVLIGTPEYMSPEQADPAGIDIDTRTDIYSLGIVLYELLVGSVPFGVTRLRAAGYAELIRIIREEEPDRPSTRLTTEAGAADVARRRDTRVPVLAQQLRGDLDWVTLRALEKDRARRYASVSEFAADLARYLQNEPVVARPPSVSYRVNKFVRRNRLAVMAAGLVAIAVTGGLAVSSTLYVQERQSRREAQQRAYVANMALAAADMKALATRDAKKHLNQTEPSLRGWEWRHLQLSADTSVAELLLPGQARNQAAAFSDDGRRTYWHNDESVQAWDTMSLRALATYGGFGGPILAISPGGKLVLVELPGESGGTFEASGAPLGVVEVESGRTVTTLRDSGWRVRSAVFSPDGTAVAGGYQDDLVRVWELPSGKPLAVLRQTRSEPHELSRLAFSPDAKRLVTLSSRDAYRKTDGHVYLWDVQRSRIQRELSDPGAEAVAFDAAGHRLATGGRSKAVRVWNLDTDAQPVILDGHRDTVWDIAWQGENTLLTASDDGLVRIWDLPSRTESASFPATARRLAIDPSHRRILAAQGEKIRVFDANAPAAVARLPAIVGDRMKDVAFSRDGRLVGSFDAEGAVLLWNVATRQLQATLRRPGAIKGEFARALAFSPRGDAVAVGYESGAVLIWDVSTGLAAQTLAGHAKFIQSVAFDTSGATLVTTSADKTVRVWDTTSGRKLAEHTFTAVPNAAVFIGDTGRVAVGLGDWVNVVRPGPDPKNLQFWDSRADRVVPSDACPHGGPVTALAISSDSDLALVCDLQAVIVWNVKLNEQRSLIHFESAGFGITYDVAFTPDGRRVVTGSEDGTVRLWDIDTGDPLLVLRHPTRSVTRLDVSSDSSRIASSDGHAIYLWETRPASEIQARTLLAALAMELDLSVDIKARINADRTLTAEVRAAALQLAEIHRDDPVAQNEKAWETVMTRTATSKSCRSAGRLAEAAVRAWPWREDFVTTLALAQYRVGDWQKCTETLAPSMTATSATAKAIAAMARFRIGQTADARSLLDSARTLLKAQKPTGDQKQLLAEAASLIEGK